MHNMEQQLNLSEQDIDESAGGDMLRHNPEQQLNCIEFLDPENHTNLSMNENVIDCNYENLEIAELLPNAGNAPFTQPKRRLACSLNGCNEDLPQAFKKRRMCRDIRVPEIEVSSTMKPPPRLPQAEVTNSQPSVPLPLPPQLEEENQGGKFKLYEQLLQLSYGDCQFFKQKEREFFENVLQHWKEHLRYGKC